MYPWYSNLSAPLVDLIYSIVMNTEFDTCHICPGISMLPLQICSSSWSTNYVELCHLKQRTPIQWPRCDYHCYGVNICSVWRCAPWQVRGNILTFTGCSWLGATVMWLKHVTMEQISVVWGEILLVTHITWLQGQCWLAQVYLWLDQLGQDLLTKKYISYFHLNNNFYKNVTEVNY